MKKIYRQSLSNRIIHWLVALSTFALLISGFGQMPMYTRYGFTKIPGFAWSADFSITLYMHYIAGAVLVFAVVYHIVYHTLRKEFDILPRRGDFKESVLVIGSMLKLCKAPECDKYLGEQRLAYAYIGGNILTIIITGLIKVYKNLPGIEISNNVLWTVTTVHNAAAMFLILGIFGHLAAFVFKENRVLLPAMFSGCINLVYIEERHTHWYNKILTTPGQFKKLMCRTFVSNTQG